MSEHPLNENSRAESARARVKAGLASIGTALQKINLSKLIDDMEHDQELADKLEVINTETDEEVERKRIVQEALAKCKAEIEDHLSTFLFFHPNASYEEWIEDLHPENINEGRILADLKDVDLRFYVEDSDHRLLWNSRVDAARQVAARTYKHDGGQVVDLLNDSFSVQSPQGDGKDIAASRDQKNPLIDLSDDGLP
jgi:hypothetical protein